MKINSVVIEIEITVRFELLKCYVYTGLNKQSVRIERSEILEKILQLCWNLTTVDVKILCKYIQETTVVS